MKTDNKTVLITGAARRIGRSIALHLAQQGWNIAIHYNTSAEKAKELAKDLGDFGVKTALIQGNLSYVSDVSKIIQTTNDHLGQINLLINNASTFNYDSIHTATFETWNEHLIPNLWAPVKLSQDFSKQIDSGLIINIIDQRVWNLTPHYLSYTASKSGLWALTQSIALALAPKIRVNGIGPGPILQGVSQTPEQFLQQCLNTPLRTGGSIADICSAVDFFIKSSTVTGQMIAIDGGQHLGWGMPADPQERED